MEKNIQASETAGGASLAVDLPECSFFIISCPNSAFDVLKEIDRLCLTAARKKPKQRRLSIPSGFNLIYPFFPHSLPSQVIRLIAAERFNRRKVRRFAGRHNPEEDPDG